LGDGPARAILSESQLATLGAVGEERTAAVDDVLFAVGDLRYPLIAIIEGEAAILDGAGNEIIRHGPSGFLGEINLPLRADGLSDGGRDKAMRYNRRRPGRAAAAALRRRTALRAAALHLHGAPRGTAADRGNRFEIVGPRSSDQTRRIVDFARSNRLPYTWRDTEHDDPAAVELIEGLELDELPLVLLPGGIECAARRRGRSRARSGSDSTWRHARMSTSS